MSDDDLTNPLDLLDEWRARELTDAERRARNNDLNDQVDLESMGPADHIEVILDNFNRLKEQIRRLEQSRDYWKTVVKADTDEINRLEAQVDRDSELRKSLRWALDSVNDPKGFYRRERSYDGNYAKALNLAWPEGREA